MIKPATIHHKEAILALAKTTEMFTAEEFSAMEENVSAYFDGHLGPAHFWVVEEGVAGLVGAAFYGPDPMADRVWNLFFIGVAPSQRRGGVGTRFLKYVESAVCALSARILLIETSGFYSFEPARRLYHRQGYREAARIPEYYKEGEDKLVFWKKMSEGLPCNSDE